MASIGSFVWLSTYYKNNVEIFRTVLLLLLCLFAACETAPPVQEMSDARQAIAVAKGAGAAELAAFHLNAAEKYLASAEKKLNERAYNTARSAANQAKMKALEAVRASEDLQDTVDT